MLALRFPAFRRLFFGQFTAGTAQMMQMVAAGWLVVEVAQRDGVPELAPLYIGLTGLARGIPAVAFGLVGSVVADRVDRRTILWMSRVVCAAGISVLAALTATGNVNIIWILALLIVDASAFAFDPPARLAMISRVVSVESLPAAIGIMTGSMTAVSFLGPLIGGLLIVPLGSAGLMFVNVAIYIVSVGALLGLPSAKLAGPSRGSGLSSLLEGLRFVVRDPMVRWVIGISSIVGLFARPVQQMLPAVAHDSLHVGAQEFSWLLTAYGLGSLLGTVIAASLGRVRRRGLVAYSAVVAWGAIIVAFGVQTNLAPALLFIFLAGVCHWTVSGTAHLILQTQTPDEYRGRVIGLYVLTALALPPLGVLLSGSLATLTSLPAALVAAGVIVGAMGLYVMVRVPVVRRYGLPVA